MATNFKTVLKLSVAPANPALATDALFDKTQKDSRQSPLDEFLGRLHAINRLAPSPTSFDYFQSQLVLLGVVAAVESYFRTLFRKLISIDPVCQSKVHDRDVSFGAALYLSKELLPEAILERFVFASRKAITEGLRDLMGVSGNFPPDLLTAIDDYIKVCHLRHCAVHRFGKLGARNAIELGLQQHKELLEKPLKIDYVALQNAIAIATGLVKTVNNFMFNEVLSRVPETEWTGVYSTDRSKFLAYYNVFRDSVSAHRSPAPSATYKEFRRQYAAWKTGAK